MRGGRVAVDVAEVALAVDERVAQRERLRHADERVVDRLVAVRVEAAPSRRRRRRRTSRTAGSAAGRSRASRTARGGARASGRRARRAAPRDDHAHRVVEEARAHLLLELARLDAARRRAGSIASDIEDPHILRVLLDELRGAARPGRPSASRRSRSASSASSTSTWTSIRLRRVHRRLPELARGSSRRGP